MTVTYDSLSTLTLSSPQSSITFSGFSSAFTDLRIVFQCSPSSSGGEALMRFNGDNGANYSYLIQNNDGTGTPNGLFSETSSAIPGNVGGNLGTSVRKTLYTWDIFNYASTAHWKPVLCTNNLQINNPGNNHMGFGGGIWRNTAAITSITISGATYATGSIITLFGIKAE